MRISLSATAWRRLLLALCFLSIFVTGYGMWLTGRFGDTGISLRRLTGAAVVAPGSPAARAGLRTGDIVDLRLLPDAARYRWTDPIPVGVAAEVPVRHGSRASIVRVVATPISIPFTFWLALFGELWMVLFATLLAWRRSELPEARVLVLFFAEMPLLQVLENGGYTPWPQLDFAVNAVGSLFDPAVALLAVYAMLFRTKHSGLRRVLAYTAYTIACLGMLHALAVRVGYWFGLPGLLGLAPIGTGETLQSLTFLVSYLCLLATVWQAEGVQRTRTAWIAACIGPYCIFTFLVWELAAFGAFNATLRAVLDVFIFFAPVGLWISLLNRRLFDIGFAINRAVVFTGVSVVIVGIFVLVEWAFSEWFSSASHTTNLAVSAALALALGLSVRAIHSRVDRVLDTVFFRKRHEDEQAIRTLAREAAYVTDPHILLSRIVTVLEEHADASSAQVLLDDDTGHYGGVSENDPAIVRLRATREPLDLGDVHSAIAGEFAYPMLARGRLVGALVLGLKRSGEAYAPDESDAIMQLAHDAGAALDVLLMKKDVSRDGVLERLHESNEAILAGIRELQARLG